MEAEVEVMGLLAERGYGQGMWVVFRSHKKQDNRLSPRLSKRNVLLPTP